MDRFARVLSTLVLIVVAFGVSTVRPAGAALGDTPREAEYVPNNDFTGFGVVGAGKNRWFRVDYPGGGKKFGITFHFRLNEQTFRDKLEIHVNTRTNEEWRVEDTNADAPGLTRIGTLTTTDKTGSGRKFWLNFGGDATTYFLRVKNDNNRPIAFALSVKQDDEPARYIQPPDNLNLVEGTALLPPGAPTPTPQPTPRFIPANPNPTFDTAIQLASDDETHHALIGPGHEQWYRVDYPGGNVDFGITLHMHLDDRRVAVDEKLEVFVNTRITPDTQGEHNKDLPGYSRLGALTLTDDQVVVRMFWLNSLEPPVTYYLRVNNHNDYTINYALSIRQSEFPVEWIAPQNPATLAQ